ncbi:laminin subunit gamma-1 isoform X2 [Schistocerca americana]|uniref:laminin subunit gamma-1 isoform X2 n=1 Tax=Schistocerca americana TaxID=7009 RepID=UPI001F4F9722|nr:laminin subunit gamma-1 isoform X2 [Schistocerca americana]
MTMASPWMFSLLLVLQTASVCVASQWDGVSWFFDSSCNCNGFSNRCFFDKDLYEKTGHGGHCIDCTGNRDGPNCERCKENFYQREDGYCIACNCNEIGSRSLQCNREGRCQCKPGVTGDKCDHCDVNYYDFTSLGCRSCGCNAAGSYGNEPNCNPYTGACQCKENVEGKRCGGCKPGYFNLDIENEFGCTPCFCYGHSSQCESAPGYSKVTIESMFARNNERWSAQDYSGNPVKLLYHSITQSIGVNAPGRDPVYFVAPDRFLGDQRASYNQLLSFNLRIGESGPGATVEDVVIEGAGLTITQAIFGQRNPLPSVEAQEYKFRLHEHPQYGWQPRLSSRDFISVLANLTAIYIRGTYTPEGVGFLDDVRLETAHRGAAGEPARWIESCRCLAGYVGQFCESCEPGFRHEPANGGPFAPCVPCNCNGHADICDAETGRCICQHNTAGDNCDRCARGYYGNALQGTAYDCKPCPCPKQGPCIQLQDETIICLECPKGYGGPRCDLCSDGYFGDPTGKFGSVKLCQPCKCNDNVDPNAVGNCNRTTGECLKCIYNTGGPECDSCIPGYFGDALALPKGDCKPCQCYPPGTVETGFGPPVCDQISGQCQCKPHIYGKNCDHCEEGYYNIISGEGCQACSCDPVGSLNHTCDLNTGQCHCQPGITGLRCDVCELYHYGFSIDGCKECDCDPIGSVNLTCSPWGQCPCYENVEGRRCDRCKENKYDRQRGCIDCPACYNLVQDAANVHRAKLYKLKKVLDDIASNPTVISDDNFERRLKEVEEAVGHLWTRAKQAVGGGGRSLSERLDDLIKRLEAVGNITKQIDSGTRKAELATRQGEEHVTEAETIIEAALQTLKETMDLLQTEGYLALQKAKEQSDQFGQQSNQMSENAREARIFASGHEQEANAIKQIAEKAVNTSTQAYELAKQAVDQQQNLSDEIRKLKNDIDSAANQLELTKALTNDAKQRAEKSHTDALNIYSEISALHIPQTDIAKLKSDAEAISARAKQIREDAEALLESETETLDDLEEQLIRAEDLLAQAIEQQQQADDLLADVHAASEEAEEALKLANKTLADAQETYNTLQAFDKQVQDSKDLATEALGKVPEIERLITEAENKTDRARQALAGAVQNAQYARDTAQEAQNKFAEQASQEADSIRKRANDTKSEAVRLRDEADALSGRVAVTGNNVKLFEDTASKVRNLTDEAKTKVGQAKSSAAEATDQIQAALADVQAIIEELSRLPDIDAAALDDLERRLSVAENELRNANIEERIETLKYYRLEQNQWIKSHEEELRRLQQEVDNIEAIQATLPEGCWKRLVLEP